MVVCCGAWVVVGPAVVVDLGAVVGAFGVEASGTLAVLFGAGVVATATVVVGAEVASCAAAAVEVEVDAAAVVTVAVVVAVEGLELVVTTGAVGWVAFVLLLRIPATPTTATTPSPTPIFFPRDSFIFGDGGGTYEGVGELEPTPALGGGSPPETMASAPAGADLLALRVTLSSRQ